MRNYVLRRLLVAIPSLLLASLIVFTLPRLIPGDVVQLMLQEKAYGKDLEDLRAKLGLNRPIHVQYVEWLLAVGRGHLGESLWTRQTVLSELTRRLPVRRAGGMELGGSILIGIPSASSPPPTGRPPDFSHSSNAISPVHPGGRHGHPREALRAIWWG